MVATVTDIGSASSTIHYFEQDGYYAKGDPEHRRASFWQGQAARALGLGRHVSPKRFNAVLLGYVPGTDIRLGRMRDGGRQHRPGLDITLSAPKSVSLAALLHGDRRVVRAHDEAVPAALDFVEAELLQTRGWDPGARRRPRVKAHGMAAATFRHLASRNLDPAAGHTGDGDGAAHSPGSGSYSLPDQGRFHSAGDPTQSRKPEKALRGGNYHGVGPRGSPENLRRGAWRRFRGMDTLRAVIGFPPALFRRARPICGATPQGRDQEGRNFVYQP